MSALLKTFYASNPVGEQRQVTLEFAHSAILTTTSDMVDTDGYLRLAQSHTDITAGTSLVSPSPVATFRKAGFGFTFPNKDSTGRQELNFQIDNVSQDAWRVIKAIKEVSRVSAERCIITMRVHLASDLGEVQEEYVFTAKRYEITRDSCLVTGAFHELVNRRAPKRLYLPSIYPGLKYI